MSMNCNYVEITPALLRRIQATPELVEIAIHGDYADSSAEKAEEMNDESLLKFLPAGQRSKMREMLKEMSPEQVASLRAQLAKLHPMIKQPNGNGKISRDELGESFSLEKAWQGVHYLLYGTAFPDAEGGSNPIFGGMPIGPELGYGPTRYLTPEQCREAVAYLDAADMAQLRSRFDVEAMPRENIYPNVWGEPDVVDWLLTSIGDLRRFFQAVVQRGNAILLFIS